MGPALAQIRPVKSVTPEEIAKSSIQNEQSQTRSDTGVPTENIPVAPASSRDEPDFNMEQIRSFVQNIKEQHDGYSRDSSEEGISQSDFLDGLKGYGGSSGRKSTSVVAVMV